MSSQNCSVAIVNIRKEIFSFSFSRPNLLILAPKLLENISRNSIMTSFKSSFIPSWKCFNWIWLLCDKCTSMHILQFKMHCINLKNTYTYCRQMPIENISLWVLSFFESISTILKWNEIIVYISRFSLNTIHYIHMSNVHRTLIERSEIIKITRAVLCQRSRMMWSIQVTLRAISNENSPQNIVASD